MYLSTLGYTTILAKPKNATYAGRLRCLKRRRRVIIESDFFNGLISAVSIYAKEEIGDNYVLIATENMTTEISVCLVCVSLRNGVEIWIEKDKAESLMAALSSPNPPQFIKYGGRLLNRADIVGVFEASDMDSLTRRKNGQWKCASGKWHDKGEKCECLPKARQDLKRRQEEAIAACGKCDRGFVREEGGGMSLCECVKSIK